MGQRAETIRESPGEPPADSELVRRVQKGEKQAFAPLVHRHTRTVYRVILGIVDNPADAEEIVQEAFLKAFQHIQSFRGEAKFRTWLIQIAVNEARMRHRKYRPNLHDSLDEELGDGQEYHPRELADWRLNPEEKLAKKEMSLLIGRGIRSLPKGYREVFLLRDVEHLSNEEAAAALELTVPAVKTRLLRARLMMREYMAPYCKMRWPERLLRRLQAPGRAR